MGVMPIAAIAIVAWIAYAGLFLEQLQTMQQYAQNANGIQYALGMLTFILGHLAGQVITRLFAGSHFFYVAPVVGLFVSVAVIPQLVQRITSAF